MQPNMSDWEGSPVYDSHGEKIGKVKRVFVDEETKQPEWLVVETGMLRHEALVPITGLEEIHKGIRLPFSEEQVKKAPHRAGGDVLTTDQERELYSYYGIPYSTDDSSSVLPAHGEEMAGQPRTGESAGDETLDYVDRQQGDIDEEEPGKRAA